MGNKSCVNTGVAGFPWSIRDSNNYSLVRSTSQKSMKVKAEGCSMVGMASVSPIAVSTIFGSKKDSENYGSLVSRMPKMAASQNFIHTGMSIKFSTFKLPTKHIRAVEFTYNQETFKQYAV